MKRISMLKIMNSLLSSKLTYFKPLFNFSFDKVSHTYNFQLRKIELLSKVSAFNRKVYKLDLGKNFCLKPLAEVFVSNSDLIGLAELFTHFYSIYICKSQNM
jgi:hypothetical protein